MKMITKTLAIIFLFLASSCDKNDTLAPIPEEQKVLFQFSNVNHAWGYTNKGWFIDNEGNVLKYDVDKTVDWHFSQSGFLSSYEMLENYSHAVLTEIKVNEKELQEMFNLIDEAKEGKLSEAKSQGADMGAFVFSGYAFDSNTSDYEHVFLSQNGDWVSENTNKKAKKITKWLAEINEKIN